MQSRNASAVLDAAKHRAKRLGDRLHQLGVPLTHTQSLEALAASDGYADWNRCAAVLSAPTLPEVFPFSVFFARPGDGASTLWRFHALNVLDQRPNDNVLMVFPHWFDQSAYASAWLEKTQAVVLPLGSASTQAQAWPSLAFSKGKALIVMPPQGISDEDLGLWLAGVVRSWRSWKGSNRTRAFFGVDLHRYPASVRGKAGLFEAARWSIEVRLFTQMFEDVEQLVQPGLSAMAWTKGMQPRDRQAWAMLESNVSLLTPEQRLVSDAELGTFEGLARALAGPLRRNSLREASIAGWRRDRMLSMLEEELEIHQARNR